jgi:uncharacterized protein
VRIAIVGAGGAGLTAAWLLEGEHEVTLFEQDERLGGHAETVEVEQEGGSHRIDTGFEFFSASMFPTLLRLLNLLAVPLHRFPMTFTYFTTDGRQTVVMPPLRPGGVAWSAFAPRTLALLLQFQRLLERAPASIDLEGGAFTLEEFLDLNHVSATLRDEFFYPFALGGWCVDMAEFMHFSAFNVLSYFVLNRPSGLGRSWWFETNGGTQTYISALAKSLKRTQVRRSARVIEVQRLGGEDGGFLVATDDGSMQEVDAMVLATNARQAATLLTGLRGMEERCRELGRFEYFTTTIAVHGDDRLMPRRRRHWSVFNTGFDGVHSASTVWKPWNTGTRPIFRSWVTYEDHLPTPLYALRTYEHPKVTRAYFEAQRVLHIMQGQDNVWLAGVYAHGVDSHESAILSAVHVAEHLAPATERLRALTGAGIVSAS